MFDRNRQYLGPTQGDGRKLVCNRCNTLVLLVEPQGPDPDVTPDTFVGLCCMVPLRTPGQFRASGFATTNEAPKTEVLTEPPAPPRDLRDDIRQYVDATFGSAA